jgi:hypothetical protein
LRRFAEPRGSANRRETLTSFTLLEGPPVNRLFVVLRTVAGCALLAALLAGCREGQKATPLTRAEQTKPAATGTNLPANTRTFNPD